MGDAAVPGATIDLVLPVLNEEHQVERGTRALARYLESCCPYRWSITVVDNGSSDRTWEIVRDLADSRPWLRPIRLEQRGRGRALRAAWSTTSADVVAYMDIDLSTGLEALSWLIDPIVGGEADISIGSRLAEGAKVERSFQRELISRAYNVITRAVLGYEVKDAQCGFKAVRADIARKLVGEVEDDSWFFDTELLALASGRGLRIREVPVQWVEDGDSRVRIVRTAIDDLRGVWRICKEEGFRPARCRVGSSRPHDPDAQYETLEWYEEGGKEHSRVDFDRYARSYENAVDQSVAFTGRSSAFFATRKAELLEQLAHRHVGDVSGLSVLDVGCGTGTTDRALVGRVGHLVGVDVSEEMLAVARDGVPDAQFDWYDGEKLPYADGSFDIVLAVCVLHHVPPPSRRDFTRELHRVARQDGLVVIFEHNPFNPLTRRAVSICALDKGVTLVPGRRAAALLRNSGADVLTKRNFLFSPLSGRVGRMVDDALAWAPLGGQYAMVARARKGESRGSDLSRERVTEGTVVD